MSNEVQAPISFEKLMEQVTSEARNAGMEAATEKWAEEKRKNYAAFQKGSDADYQREVRGSMREFARQLRGTPGNAAYPARFADVERRAAESVIAKTMWAMLKGGFSRENIVGMVDSFEAKQPGRWNRVQKTLEASNFSSGGGLIEGETSNDFIEALYARNVVLTMGANTVSLANGPVDLNKQNQTPVGYWVGEGQAITVSEPTFGKIILSEKQAGVLVPISEMLLELLPAGMEQIIEESMLSVLNNLLDTAYISGEGTQNSPKGIYNWLAASNKIEAADYVEGAAATLAEVTTALLTAWYQPQKANIPGLRFGWMMHPRPATFLMSLRTADGFHVFLEEVRNGRLYGDPLALTTNIPANRGGGSNETRLYFGDFSQMVIGQGRQVRVSRGQGVSFVDAQSNTVHGFQEGVELIKVTVGTDCALRHNEAFVVLDNNQWGAGFDV